MYIQCIKWNIRRVQNLGGETSWKVVIWKTEKDTEFLRKRLHSRVNTLFHYQRVWGGGDMCLCTSVCKCDWYPTVSINN